MRTQLNDWQIRVRENQDEMKYVSIEYSTVAHSPSEVVIYPIPFPEGVLGINIKTIRVQSVEAVPFFIDLMDGASNETIYESLEEMQMQYDQVDLPYKPVEKKLFVRIHNKGNVATKFKISVRGIEVK